VTSTDVNVLDVGGDLHWTECVAEPENPILLSHMKKGDKLAGGGGEGPGRQLSR
jgi:hypothetical protein